MRTMYRHKTPVDDEIHIIEACGGISGTGNIIFSGPLAFYEFWAEHDPKRNRELKLQVYGTGHEIPADAVYLSTSLRHSTGLVFYLYELI